MLLLSPFEQAWAKAKSGQRIIATRREFFDTGSNLLHSPTTYEYENIGFVTDQMPDDTSVIQYFDGFVRGEFGTVSNSRGDGPLEMPIYNEKITTGEIIFQYLESCERDLIYSGLASGIIRGVGTSTSKQIYALLADPLLGNKANHKFLPVEPFLQRIDDLIAKKERIQFVLPAFPFKDQNIFRTNCRPDNVDLAEIALLIRLHTLCLAIYQAHPYGSNWIILSDGTAYAEILGVNINDAKSYYDKILEYRNTLNLHQTVSIIDLNDFANNLVSEKMGNKIFGHTKESIRKNLFYLVKDKKTDVYSKFRVLVRGIKWNINYKAQILDKNISYPDVWKILNLEEEENVPNNLIKHWRLFDEIAIDAAFDYAAFNIALKYLNAYEQGLPNTLRATIHPKPDQIAVPSLGNVFPWNGVGIVKNRPIKYNSIECRELYKLLAEKPNSLARKLIGMQDPIFYDIN